MSYYYARRRQAAGEPQIPVLSVLALPWEAVGRGVSPSTVLYEAAGWAIASTSTPWENLAVIAAVRALRFELLAGVQAGHPIGWETLAGMVVVASPVQWEALARAAGAVALPWEARSLFVGALPRARVTALAVALPANDLAVHLPRNALILVALTKPGGGPPP